MWEMLSAVKKLFFQKLSLSCFRFPIQLGFGEQPWFSISVPHCLCLFWALELCKRKASHCRNISLRRKVSGAFSTRHKCFSPEFGGYFEEGFELDGDAREGLKVEKMFSSSLRCKNDYLFKMRKTPAGGFLKNDLKLGRGHLFSLISLMAW